MSAFMALRLGQSLERWPEALQLKHFRSEKRSGGCQHTLSALLAAIAASAKPRHARLGIPALAAGFLFLPLPRNLWNAARTSQSEEAFLTAARNSFVVALLPSFSSGASPARWWMGSLWRVPWPLAW